MSSIIKVDTIQDSGGNQILTSNGSGVITGNLSARPAFEAYLSSDQSGNGDNVAAKLQADTEVYDTDSCYDNSTNYRFTPNVAGKYFVYNSSKIQCDTANTMAFVHVQLYKNGSEYKKVSFDPVDNQATSITLFCGAVIDFNGTTDYVEAYGLMNVTGSGNTWRFDAEVKSCSFGAYKLPGV